MYRSMVIKEYQKIAGKRTVLQIALDVHGTTVGSYDRCLDKQKKDIQLLKMILSKWEPSILLTEKFDNAVKNILEIALLEAIIKEPID